MESRSVVIHADIKPMRGVVNPGPHQTYVNPRVSVEPRELGDLHPDEIRVEMIYAGLCGTDLHLVESDPDTGYVRCSAPAKIPPEGRVLGHEGVGRIVAIGSNVRHLKPGIYVAFESIIVCNHCSACRRGRFNQCRNARLFGLEKDGLFGTVVDVPSMLAHDVTEFARTDKGLKAVACLEPAGVAFVACQNGKVTPGDRVLVFGAGPIGLFSAMFSKNIFGASEVYVVEPVQFRRNLARKWCDRIFDVDEFFYKNRQPVDVVIEASGQLDNIGKTFSDININGRVVLLARSGVPLVLDNVDHMITNAVLLTGSRGHLGGAFSAILSLYRNGRIPLGQLVTEVVDGPERLAELLNTPQRILLENCKVLVQLNDVQVAV